MLTDNLSSAGEKPFQFQGTSGLLEGILLVPPELKKSTIALLGHPHSLQGGSMNNKVVTTMARAFKELGIASLRFNFRGVGQSQGEYDHGIGESEDMLALAQLWQREKPDTAFYFAGFSFGSYVAYRAAAQWKASALITVAPPVHHYNYEEFQPQPEPWFIMQGNDDEVVPLSVVLEFTRKVTPRLDLTQFAETGHFFHGKLLELKAALIEKIKAS